MRYADTHYYILYLAQNFQKLYDELSQDRLYTLYKRVDFQEYWDRFSV